MARSNNIISCLTFVLLLVFANAIDYEYGPKPELDKLKSEEKKVALSPYDADQKPAPEPLGCEENQPNDYVKEDQAKPRGQEYQYHSLPTDLPDHEYSNGHDHIRNIGIQGLILCKSGPKCLPLAGALARITCLAEDENGYEAAPFYTESHETNEDGYFLVTFSLSEVIGSDKLKLKECKAFLENSPLETCKVPTDVNYGITGAFLSLPRFLPEKLMTLYTVGPFIYTSDTNSVPADDHSAGPDGHY